MSDHNVTIRNKKSSNVGSAHSTASNAQRGDVASAPSARADDAQKRLRIEPSTGGGTKSNQLDKVDNMRESGVSSFHYLPSHKLLTSTGNTHNPQTNRSAPSNGVSLLTFDAKSMRSLSPGEARQHEVSTPLPPTALTGPAASGPLGPTTATPALPPVDAQHTCMNYEAQLLLGIQHTANERERERERERGARASHASSEHERLSQDLHQEPQHERRARMAQQQQQRQDEARSQGLHRERLAQMAQQQQQQDEERLAQQQQQQQQDEARLAQQQQDRIRLAQQQQQQDRARLAQQQQQQDQARLAQQQQQDRARLAQAAQQQHNPAARQQSLALAPSQQDIVHSTQQLMHLAHPHQSVHPGSHLHHHHRHHHQHAAHTGVPQQQLVDPYFYNEAPVHDYHPQMVRTQSMPARSRPSSVAVSGLPGATPLQHGPPASHTNSDMAAIPLPSAAVSGVGTSVSRTNSNKRPLEDDPEEYGQGGNSGHDVRLVLERLERMRVSVQFF